VQTLIEPGHLDWPALIEKLTAGPARILGINKGTLAADADADITLIDPAAEWTIDPGRFRSKGRNTPFAGRAVRGRIQTVLVNGEVRYRCDD
jgi:dihydroorotase